RHGHRLAIAVLGINPRAAEPHGLAGCHLISLARRGQEDNVGARAFAVVFRWRRVIATGFRLVGAPAVGGVVVGFKRVYRAAHHMRGIVGPLVETGIGRVGVGGHRLAAAEVKHAAEAAVILAHAHDAGFGIMLFDSLDKRIGIVGRFFAGAFGFLDRI